MNDNFKFPWEKNQEITNLSDLQNLWDNAFNELISVEADKVHYKLLYSSHDNASCNLHGVKEINISLLKNYLFDVKNQN
jgi:hypothetical protein